MINPSQVPNWIVVIYERQQRFSDQVANQMAADLVRACEAVGTASIGCRGHHLTQILQGST